MLTIWKPIIAEWYSLVTILRIACILTFGLWTRIKHLFVLYWVTWLRRISRRFELLKKGLWYCRNGIRIEKFTQIHGNACWKLFWKQILGRAWCFRRLFHLINLQDLLLEIIHYTKYVRAIVYDLFCIQRWITLYGIYNPFYSVQWLIPCCICYSFPNIKLATTVYD